MEPHAAVSPWQQVVVGTTMCVSVCPGLYLLWQLNRLLRRVRDIRSATILIGGFTRVQLESSIIATKQNLTQLRGNMKDSHFNASLSILLFAFENYHSNACSNLLNSG